MKKKKKKHKKKKKKKNKKQQKNHILDRARTQFKLVADMEAKWYQMNAIVEKYL